MMILRLLNLNSAEGIYSHFSNGNNAWMFILVSVFSIMILLIICLSDSWMNLSMCFLFGILMCIVGLYYPQLYDFFMHENPKVMSPRVEAFIDNAERVVRAVEKSPMSSMVIISTGLAFITTLVYFSFSFAFSAAPTSF